MKMLTVKQVAKSSGVSVRALHHHDEIGLLRPASTGRNGYRYYGRDELLRLQQILLHRELDIPLAAIRTILDDPGLRHADLYKGISPEKQAEYEAWLVKRYGGDMPQRIATGRRKHDSLSEDEKAAIQEDLEEIEGAWADAMKNGIPAESAALDPLLERFREWVARMWGRPCPPEAFAGLADLHLGHPDFVARYEVLGAGLSDYHAAAMKAYADRLGR